MTQEDKELLLKDLCGRLPYGVKCSYFDINIQNTTYGVLEGFEEKEIFVIDDLGFYVEDIKPFLFPMSSMTEKQKNELESLRHIKGNTSYKYHASCVDFYNSNHLDNRELIEKGLAIDATNLGIYE